jgi:preprotein translocase subunit SecY
MFPATIANFVPLLQQYGINEWFQFGGVIYNLFFVGFIVFFCYFYTSIVFKTDDVAENLKKQGGFIPGVRPGPETMEYLNRVIERLTLGGAVYISVICVVPTVLIEALGAPQSLLTFLGGTSVLILVGVAMDTLSQVETFLLQSNYEGFMKHARVKGRSATT